MFLRLSAVAFLAYCSYAVCRSPLLPLFARDLGATPQMVGLVVAASTVTGILLKLPAGAWSDVLGRRPLLVAGAIVFATMPFTYLAVGSIGALVALRLVHGSATAIFGPVASASVSDLAPAHRRGAWLSTYAAVQGTGQALGPIVAGYLVAARQYDAAFLVAGALALSTPLLVAGWPGAASAPEPGAPAPRGQVAEAIAGVLRSPLIVATSLAQGAQFGLSGALNAFLPLYAHEVVGISPSRIGWLFALQTVTTLAARPVMGRLSDRVGRPRLIVGGLATCASAVALVAVASTLPALAAAVSIFAVGAALTSSASSAYITDLAPRARYGAAHGVFGAIYDVGDALGPILGGLLVAAVGYTVMFKAAAATAVAFAIAFHLVSRALEAHSAVDGVYRQCEEAWAMTTAPPAPFTPLRPGTTRAGRIRLAWVQFLVLIAVLGLLVGALALAVVPLVREVAP